MIKPLILLVIILIIFLFILLLPAVNKIKIKKNGSSNKKRDWQEWKNRIAVPLTIAIFMVSWWQLWPNSFNKATGTSEFWVGFLFVIFVWGFLLSIPKSFEKRYDRKLFAIVALIGGIVLMASKILPPESATALQNHTRKHALQSFTSQPRVIRVAIQPDKWSEEIVVGSRRKFTSDAPDWQEFLLLRSGDRIRADENGTITLTKRDGRQSHLPKGPVQFADGEVSFKLRGAVGTATVTIF